MPQLELLSYVLDAWAATAAQGRGLFRTPSSAGPAAEPHDGIVPHDNDASVVVSIASHHIWLLFWIEVWQVRGGQVHPLLVSHRLSGREQRPVHALYLAVPFLIR